jgi:hypothetical protein
MNQEQQDLETRQSVKSNWNKNLFLSSYNFWSTRNDEKSYNCSSESYSFPFHDVMTTFIYCQSFAFVALRVHYASLTYFFITDNEFRFF